MKDVRKHSWMSCMCLLFPQATQTRTEWKNDTNTQEGPVLFFFMCMSENHTFRVQQHRRTDRNQRRVNYLSGASSPPPQLSFHLTSVKMHTDVRPTTSAGSWCGCPPFPLFGRNVNEEKPPLTFHIQAILISTQTMVDRLLSSAPKHRSPPPFAKTFTHVCATRGDTDVVTLYGEVGTINARVYRYSSALSGGFFPWSCRDLNSRCAATGRHKRRAPPTATRDRRRVPHFCLYNMPIQKRGHMIFSISMII